MFTGIIEQLGEVTAIRETGSNRVFDILAPFPDSIKVDQSIAHDGVCLTVTDIFKQNGRGTHYSVTAVDETLKKTRLGSLEAGHCFNIERCMKVGDRLDGHFVQGHVDTVGEVIEVNELEGSWMYHFRFPEEYARLIVNKGSICVNGISLTVVETQGPYFSVTIIPYTYEHTNFHQLKVGDPVNLEFDILGKYILKAQDLHKSSVT